MAKVQFVVENSQGITQVTSEIDLDDFDLGEGLTEQYLADALYKEALHAQQLEALKQQAVSANH